MNTITLIWIALPFLVGFSIYLLPKLDRWLALGLALASASYALVQFFNDQSLTLNLLDNFGVTLVVDQLT